MRRPRLTATETSVFMLGILLVALLACGEQVTIKVDNPYREPEDRVLTGNTQMPEPEPDTFTLLRGEPRTVTLGASTVDVVLLSATDTNATLLVNGTRVVLENATYLGPGYRLTRLASAARQVVRPRPSTATVEVADFEGSALETIRVGEERELRGVRVRLEFIVPDMSEAMFRVAGVPCTVAEKESCTFPGGNLTVEKLRYFDATSEELVDAATVTMLMR